MALYEYIPNQNYWTGVFENGCHQGMVEEAALNFIMGCLCGDAFQYYATIEVGYILGLAAGFDPFVYCCLSNPGAECL